MMGAFSTMLKQETDGLARLLMREGMQSQRSRPRRCRQKQMKCKLLRPAWQLGKLCCQPRSLHQATLCGQGRRAIHSGPRWCSLSRRLLPVQPSATRVRLTSGPALSIAVSMLRVQATCSSWLAHELLDGAIDSIALSICRALPQFDQVQNAVVQWSKPQWSSSHGQR